MAPTGSASISQVSARRSNSTYGQVHGVDHQLPDPAYEQVGFDAGVGGDAGHQSGLGDADLAGGECVVPHGHGAAQAGFLDSAVGFAAGELQVVFHPVLGGEEPEITKRLRDIEMIGHGDGGGVGLTAELFDPCGPRHGGRLVEVGGIERFEHRQPLCAVLDRRGNPLRTHHTSVGADGDVGDRIEGALIVGRIPVEPVAQP